MTSNILDHPVPGISTSILQPTLYKLIPKAVKDLASETTVQAKNKITNFADWLMSYTPLI